MRSVIGFPLVLVAIVVFISACSEVKKMDEMKDNTADMRQTTKDLSEKTSEMNQQVKELLTLTREELLARLAEVSSSTASLFDAMRQGDTSGLRRAGIVELLKQTTLQGRLAEAGLYLQGFEFQVLRNVGRDSEPEFRATLYHQAMLEFFLKVEELAPKLGEIEPTASPSVKDDTENRTSAFNAIAFALHKTNRQQLPDPTYGRPMSVYDLIMVSLELKPYIDSGQIVLPAGPSFIKEVLGNSRRVEQLLQTRYNMFVFALIGATTNLSERGRIAQLWTLVRKLDVDLTEKTVGPAVLQRIDEEIVTPALRTTRDMLNVGITPRFTKKTAFALSRLKMHFGDETALMEQWQEYTAPKLEFFKGSQR